jgi:hypothetical protein
MRVRRQQAFGEALAIGRERGMALGLGHGRAGGTEPHPGAKASVAAPSFR